MKAIFEVDDYPKGYVSCMQILDELKEKNKAFKATLYAIPSLMREEHWDEVEDRDWLQVGMHGFEHEGSEGRFAFTVKKHQIRSLTAMTARRKLEKYADKRFEKIFKAPHYGYCPDMIEACKRLGITIVIRDKIDLLGIKPEYLYWFKNLEFEIGVKVIITGINKDYKVFHCHTGGGGVTNINKRMKKYKRVIKRYEFVFSQDVAKWV